MSFIPVRPRARRATVVITAAVAAAALLASGGVAAQAATGEGTVLFDEDFESAGSSPVLLTDYIGAAKQRYTADANWLTACNGNVIAGSSPDAGFAEANCTRKSDAANRIAYDAVRQLAWALGTHTGMADPWQNHVLAAFTDGANPGAGVQMMSVDEISVRPAGRYIALSVDAAALSCAASGPQYSFEVHAGTSVTQLGTSSLCTDTGAYNVRIPAIRTGGIERTARVATVTSAAAMKFTGSAMQVVVRNANGSGVGNDAAVDNMRVLDVTPALSVSLADTNTVGDVTPLTFRIDNTDEHAAKAGWSFTSALPAGITVAGPAARVTCRDAAGNTIPAPGITVTAGAGDATVSANGDLPAGAASCSIAIDVTAPEGSYATAPTDITSAFLDTTAVTAQAATWSLPADSSETATTPAETAVEIAVLSDFAPVSGDETPTAPDASSFRFATDATTVDTVEGAWSYDATTGRVTFTPAPGYAGTTAALPYSYRDTNGNRVASTITVTVLPPVASDEPAPTNPAPQMPAQPAPVPTVGGEHQDAPAQDVPVEDAPAEDAPVEDAPAEDVPAEDVPAGDAPAEDAPAEGAPAEDAPAEDVPAVEVPAEVAPVVEAPVEEAPATETPVTEAPVTEAPAAETPVTTEPTGEVSSSPAAPAAVEPSAIVADASSEPSLAATGVSVPLAPLLGGLAVLLLGLALAFARRVTRG